MSLSSLSRPVVLLLAAASALLGVACSGDNGQPTYTATDLELNPTAAIAPLGCTTGDVKSCTIYLGRHGDLSNCVEGLDVCSAGAWTGCIDEETLSENPELMSQLTAE